MQRLIKHVTGNLLAGIGVALPLGLTAYVIFKIEEVTKPLTEALFGRSAPFVGLGLILLAIYLFGLLVTSLSGQYLFGRIDHLLSRLPGACPRGGPNHNIPLPTLTMTRTSIKRILN